MCQPGRPWPSAVSHACSPGLAAFHRAKSRGGVLLVFVDIDARAGGVAAEVVLRELAVFGVAVDAEVPGAVLGAIGEAALLELLDERDHLGDVFGGVRHDDGREAAEGVEVFEEGALVARGVVGDGDALRGGVADDLVVDVGDVHDVLDLDALLLKKAAEQIDMDEGAEVADVAVVVDGGAAGVEGEGLAVRRGERFDLCAEGVEELKCHAFGLERCRAGLVSSDFTGVRFRHRAGGWRARRGRAARSPRRGVSARRRRRSWRRCPWRARARERRWAGRVRLLSE